MMQKIPIDVEAQLNCAQPRAYVVVLNWNRYEYTKKCLESLQDCQYPNLKLVVVDNASADKSGDRLRSEFPQHKFIFNSENLGFARGCNVGIRAALEDETCRYVLLINNDATLEPDGLAKAIECAEASQNIGAISGKVLQSRTTKVIWYAGGRIDRIRGQAVVRGFGEIDRGQFDQSCDVGFVTGGLMLIKKEVLMKVGLLPEEYFFGVEEWDFSLAVLAAGYRLYFVPELVALHKGDGSHSNSDAKFLYNYYRNKLIFQQKYLPNWLFGMWLNCFICYGRFVASRLLFRDTGASGHKALPEGEFNFAVAEAIRDHGKNVLSEKTMLAFEQKLAKRRISV